MGSLKMRCLERQIELTFAILNKCKVRILFGKLFFERSRFFRNIGRLFVAPCQRTFALKRKRYFGNAWTFPRQRERMIFGKMLDVCFTTCRNIDLTFDLFELFELCSKMASSCSSLLCLVSLITHLRLAHKHFLVTLGLILPNYITSCGPNCKSDFSNQKSIHAPKFSRLLET